MAHETQEQQKEEFAGEYIFSSFLLEFAFKLAGNEEVFVERPMRRDERTWVVLGVEEPDDLLLPVLYCLTQLRGLRGLRGGEGGELTLDLDCGAEPHKVDT